MRNCLSIIVHYLNPGTLSAKSIQSQIHVLRLGLRVAGVLRERSFPLQIQVVLHGNDRRMMKRQALVLDEVAKRLVGAGVPSSRPRVLLLLLVTAEVLARLRSVLILRSQTLIETHIAGETVTRRILRVEGSAVLRFLAILEEAVEAQEVGVSDGAPLVEQLLAATEEVVLMKANRRDRFRLRLVLEATALEVARVLQHPQRAVRRAASLMRRPAGDGWTGPCVGVLEFLGEGSGEVMQQLRVPRLLVVVLELVNVHFDTLIFGRRHEVLVVSVVHA